MNATNRALVQLRKYQDTTVNPEPKLSDYYQSSNEMKHYQNLAIGTLYVPVKKRVTHSEKEFNKLVRIVHTFKLGYLSFLWFSFVFLFVVLYPLLLLFCLKNTKCTKNRKIPYHGLPSGNLANSASAAAPRFFTFTCLFGQFG